MKIAKQCRVCGISLVTTPTNNPAARRHCANPACDWCLPCAFAKNEQCKGKT